MTDETTITSPDAADQAHQDYLAAKAAADEAQAKADAAEKTAAQKKADEAAQTADDLRAKAAEAGALKEAAAAVPTTIEDAGTLAPTHRATMAGEHLAQKFGNDPANPKIPPGIPEGGPKVKLSRKTPDVDGLVYCEAPLELVGDYERAGWNRA